MTTRRTHRRTGRDLTGRVAVQIGKLTVACPKCGAAIGWRCIKKIGDQVLPRAQSHAERKVT